MSRFLMFSILNTLNFQALLLVLKIIDIQSWYPSTDISMVKVF